MFELIGLAETMRKGINDGNYWRELNPEYQKDKAKMVAEISQIKKAVGGE